MYLCGHLSGDLANFKSFTSASFPQLKTAHFSLVNHIPTLDAPQLELFFGDSSFTIDEQPSVKTLFYISSKSSSPKARAIGNHLDRAFPHLHNLILHVNDPMLSWSLPPTLEALCMRITHYHAFPGFDVLELPPTLQLLSVCGLNHVSWSLESRSNRFTCLIFIWTGIKRRFLLITNICVKWKIVMT